MDGNFTSTLDSSTKSRLPSLLRPLPPLIHGIPDLYLSLFIPIAVHWLTSAFFEILERTGYLMKYKLHTSAEDLLKNRVSRVDCLIATIRCQILQTLLGAYLAWGDEGDVTGTEDYDVALWTNRVHATFSTFSGLFFLTGTNFPKLRTILATWESPILPGRRYDMDLTDIEVQLANLLYWYLLPLMRLIIAVVVADFWMYCLHRSVHVNAWMYKHVHSIHHRLYVPYSWGASYGHLFDNIAVDALGYATGTWAAGLSNRLAMILFAYSSFKNVTDHCGYTISCNPVRIIAGPVVANADFHDVHHQTWGLKMNFGAHLTIWDRMFGTFLDDEDLIAKNRIKSRVAADALLIRKKLSNKEIESQLAM